jgi:hypothetical protein
MSAWRSAYLSNYDPIDKSLSVKLIVVKLSGISPSFTEPKGSHESTTELHPESD